MVGNVGVVDLVHIRVNGSTPSSAPHIDLTGVNAVPQAGGVAQVGDDEVHADRGESLGGLGDHHEGGVVAGTVSGDLDLVLKLSAGGSRGQLAILDRVAGSLEVAEGSLQSGIIALLGGHVGGVDVVAVHVNGEGDLVAVVRGLGSGPGGVGDGVVDDARALAIVGLDGDVTIDGEDSGEGLAQVLGSLAARLAADVHAGSAHAEVAVTEVIDGIGRDLVAVQCAAVGLLDGFNGVVGEGGVSNIDGAGDDAVELVVIAHALLEVEVLGLGSAKEVAVVGLEVDNAILILDVLVGACAHGDGGLGTHGAQIALGEAELVVVIVIEGGIAIVVHRSDGHAELIDGGRVDLVEGDGHAVVAGLLDTGDVGSGVTGLDADGGIVSVDVLVHHGRKSVGVADFLFHSGEGPAVLIADLESEILNGLGLAGEAPSGASSSDVALSGGAGLNAGVNDALSEGNETLVEVVPELGLLLFGPVGEVSVVTAGRGDRLGERGHTAAVSSHALNGDSVQRGVAIVGGVAEDVHGEDDVVDGDLLTVGEDDIVTHGEVVVDGAVGILDDLTVGRTIVGIVGAVVGVRFAVDALHDDLALTVAVEQAERGHHPNVLVILGLREEGGELLVERGRADDQRSVLVLGLVTALVAAAGEKTETHNQRKDQCKCSFH